MFLYFFINGLSGIKSFPWLLKCVILDISMLYQLYMLYRVQYCILMSEPRTALSFRTSCQLLPSGYHCKVLHPRQVWFWWGAGGETVWEGAGGQSVTDEYHNEPRSSSTRNLPLLRSGCPHYFYFFWCVMALTSRRQGVSEPMKPHRNFKGKNVTIYFGWLLQDSIHENLQGKELGRQKRQERKKKPSLTPTENANFDKHWNRA